MKRETISWTHDRRTIKDKHALLSLGTQITKIYDKEDVGLIDDETWENLIKVLEQKKRKFLTNAKALCRLNSRALLLENCKDNRNESKENALRQFQNCNLNSSIVYKNAM